MQELVIHLEGRYGADPSPQKIGEALRKLGWRRVRIYGQWGGRRYWLPKSDVGSKADLTEVSAQWPKLTQIGHLKPDCVSSTQPTNVHFRQPQWYRYTDDVHGLHGLSQGHR